MAEKKWLGVVVAATSGHLQFMSNTQSQRTTAVASYSITISLVALTASIPLPASNPLLKISIFHVILACASMLSSTLPTNTKLIWLPYLACIRPFFHMLPDPFQHRILHFSTEVWNKVYQRMPAPIRRVFLAAKKCLVTKDCHPVASADSESSSADASSILEEARVSVYDASTLPLASFSPVGYLILEGVNAVEVIPETDASTPSASTSTWATHVHTARV